MKFKAFYRNLFLPVLSLLIGGLAHAQGDMTAEKWQVDLRYLEKVVTTERSNLFHNLTSTEFKQAVEVLDAKIPSLQRHEFIVGLARLVAMFRIGHTILPLNVWQRGPDANIAFHRFPLLVGTGTGPELSRRLSLPLRQRRG